MTPGLKPSQPSQGQLSSLDSDDFGTILEREETLQMLRRNPSPAKWRRVDAVSIDRATRLSSLDLTVPDRLQHASAASLEEQGLAGYQALQHVRDEVAKYRQAYSDWRRGAARGARGEATFPDPDPAGAPEAAPASKEKASASLVDITALKRKERLSRPSSGEDDAMKESPSWLKFSFNPYSEKERPREPLPLCDANLPKLAAAAVANFSLPAPGSRTATSFIAHVGVGGFHRSHLAFVTDKLAQMQHASNADAERWGILGVGLMPWDRKMYDTLKKQDCLYTLLLRGNASSDARVIGAIHDFLLVPDAPEPCLQTLSSACVKILSLTVTEKGYYRNVAGELDLTNALVQEDIENWAKHDGGARGLKQPKTAFGLICTVLQRRRAAGLGPLTVFSCDNLPMNGSVCRAVTMQFARAVDAALAAWIEAEVSFPNSMVDRITPATEPEHKALLREEYGVEDEWPVIAEPFLQWVIEDNFCAGRPAWQLAMPSDVLITSNVEPYELMKLRLLNSSHSALSYAAMLCKHRFVDDALADPDIFAFLRAYMSEVVRTLDLVEGVDLAQYQRTLLERFSNTYIKDKLSRLAQDGSQKFMNTLRDALIGYREQQGLMQELVARSSWIQPRHQNVVEGTEMVALALAAFMRYTVGHDAGGEQLLLEDPLADVLKPIASRAFTPDANGQSHVATRLDATREFVRSIFGEEVAGWNAFVSNVFTMAERIHNSSCREVLCACREEQLRKIRAERHEFEARLRELHRSEQLISTPAERSSTMLHAHGSRLHLQSAVLGSK